MRVPGHTAQAKQHATRLLPAIVAGVLLTAAATDVHSQTRCVFLCAPKLKIEPTLTIENTFGPARLEQVEDGIVLGTMRQERENVLELVLAIGIPTEIPRVGFTVETIFSPFRDDTEVELELEFNLTWLEPEQTGGWVESHFDIIDKFSPAGRPTDTSAYTHKLNFELDTAVLIFNWLDAGNWLRHLEVEASLDYVATGLPRAGDIIGNERFLDDASPWSFSLVVIAPLAPLLP